MGEKTHCVPAIVFDRIRTKFNSKNIIEVVNGFTDKGYRIADQWLVNFPSDTVDKIGVLLGTSDDEILPMCTKIFGDGSKQSTFIETEIGVVFSGNIDRMIENLPFLPENVCISANSVDLEKKFPFHL